jgi:hypothetical protein
MEHDSCYSRHPTPGAQSTIHQKKALDFLIFRLTLIVLQLIYFLHSMLRTVAPTVTSIQRGSSTFPAPSSAVITVTTSSSILLPKLKGFYMHGT